MSKRLPVEAKGQQRHILRAPEILDVGCIDRPGHYLHNGRPPVLQNGCSIPRAESRASWLAPLTGSR